MNSSGIKRGLAVSAVSALALAGLAMAPAQAQTVGESSLTDIVLYTQQSGSASTRADGSNSTVTLLAGFPDVIGGDLVNSVRFSYDGGTIATVVPADGVATFEWAAPAGTHTVTATALDNGGNPIGSDSVAGVVTNGTNVSVDFTNALRAEAGEWDGEIVVRGRTSGDDVDVRALGPETTTGANSTTLSGGPGGLSNFVGVVTLGANDTADATDEVVIGAEADELDAPTSDGDDATVVTVYDQAVTTVTRTLKAGSNDNVPTGSGANTTYVLNALDQKGNPIHGLNIYEANAAGAPNNGVGTPEADETDFDGNLEVTLNEADIDGGADLDPAANKSATYYVVDVNENGSYQNGTDWLFDVRQNRYVAAPATVTTTNELGTVMDDEEFSDVEFLVKDQFGNPVSGATVRVKVDRTGHEAPVGAEPGEYFTIVSGADGIAHYQFSQDPFYDDDPSNTSSHLYERETITINGYVNNNGNPNPDAGDAIAAPYTIQADASEVVWDNGATTQVGANTTTVQRGVLRLEDGGPALPNRPLDIDFSSGTGSPGNAILAPQAAQPAGTVRGSDFEAQVTTGADGTFGVAVQDPASPTGQELGAELSAEAGGGLPNRLDIENDPATLVIDFLRSLVPTVVEIHNADDGTVDSLWSPFAGDDNLQPGKLGLGYVEAYNADGVQLTDISIPVRINEGHFIDFEDPYDPTPVPNGTFGEWKSAGKTINVTLDDNGEGIFGINIERHAGFDDNGLVSDKVIAGTGNASFEHDFQWHTMDVPLNSGSYSVELSDEQDSTVLPKARASEGDSAQEVNYDVVATDQFGNRTSQPITVSDDSPIADFYSNTGFDTQYTLDDPAVVAYSEEETDQILEVELDNQTTTQYKDDPYTGDFDPVAGFGLLFDQTTADVQENTDAINWYEVDLDTSSFVLSQEGGETVPVGSTVSYTLTATDQEGQPINGHGVGFLRVGPGNTGQDDDGQQTDVTNAAGKAFYDFAGSIPGTANVSAVVYDDRANGTYVRLFVEGPDTVVFEGKPPTDDDKVDINPKLSGENAGKRDVLTVRAKQAKGADVKVFKKNRKGRTLVGTGSLNQNGSLVVRVADRNGKKVSTYFAIVSGTDATNKARTNNKRLR